MVFLQFVLNTNILIKAFNLESLINMIYITGASGYIGNVLCNRLTSLKINFLPIHNFQKQNYDSLNKIIKPNKSNILIHLGEESNINIIEASGISSLKYANMSVKTLLSYNFSKIIYISTANLYDDSLSKKSIETENVVPYNMYTQLKKQTECLVLKQQGCVFRVSNVYSTIPKKGTVIEKIFNIIMDDINISLDNPHPVRDFIWLDDLINVILISINTNIFGIYNIGTGIGTSIGEFLNIGLKLKKIKQFEFSSNLQKQSSKLILDISKIRMSTGWSPLINIKQGLSMMLNKKYCKKKK